MGSNTSARAWEPATSSPFWENLRAVVRASRRAEGPRLESQSDTNLLRIIGALDRRLAPALKAQLREMAGREALTIDLSGVSQWDAEGLASLVHARDCCLAQGCALTLLAPSPALRQLLEKAQLHHLFAIQGREA